MWPRLLHFPIFWIGLALLGYIALQASNPSWVWERSETQWWLRRVNDIPWLPTSVDTPFERFDIWRQFIIYASAWLTVCTVWTGFTRRRALQLLLTVIVANAVLLTVMGFFQKFAGHDRFLFLMPWPSGASAFGSFIYRNHAGAYLALVASLAVALAIWIYTQGERTQRKSTPASLYFCGSLFLAAGVLFSLSRGSSLLLGLTALGITGWFALTRRRMNAASSSHPMVNWAVVGIFVAVIGVTIRSVDSSEIQGRFNSMVINYADPNESIQARIQTTEAARTMLADYWLRGAGAGGFRFLFPEYMKRYPALYLNGFRFWEHAHDDWLEIPIELGAAGSLLLLLGGAYWLRFFYRSRAAWHSLVVPILLGCSQTLAHAWFDFPFQNPAILCTWLALIAVSARWLELDSNA